MPTTTIKVAYINPAKGKGPPNIKSEDGKYYKVWQSGKNAGPPISEFAVGKTYEIEYDQGEYNGRPDYTVRKILSSSTTDTGGVNGANGSPRDGGSASRPDADRSADIKWLACLKVSALLFAGTKEVGKCLDTARFIFHEPIVTDDIVEDAKKVFNATEAKD